MAAVLLMVRLARLSTVRLPPKRVCPWIVCGCWPTTYMVEPSIRALLAPPRIGILLIGAVLALGHDDTAGRLQGSKPDCWPRRKMSGAIGTTEIEALEPPHSG